MITRENQIKMMADLLGSFGEDVNSEGMRDTPRRWLEMMDEFFQHRNTDLKVLLKQGFEDPNSSAGSGQMVMQQNIPFRGMCEHHLAPMHGVAAIGYIPKKRIVGLSKLARLTDAAGTRRPSTQEEITLAIARTLVEGLDPVGVMVVTKAFHSCMCVRGVKAPDVPTTVSSVHGAFRDNAAARQEFLMLLGR